MRIINPGFKFVYEPNAEQMLDTIEKAYRICYQSEPKGNRDSFITNKIKIGHESPLEHTNISVVIETNRGVTHEIVRHRIASFSQSSTRYCNYSKDKFGNELTFIRPEWISENVLGDWGKLNGWKECEDISDEEMMWLNSCHQCEAVYLSLIAHGWTAQQARDVLNNSIATQIVVTMNVREWRHFFKLRAIGTTGQPHPEMLQITIPMLQMFKEKIPVLFDDLEVKHE